MDIPILAVFSLLVSLGSFFFAVKAWRQANRPLITARITSNGMGGNVSTPLTIVVENTGNRPALDIQLTAKREVLDSCLVAPEEDVLRKEIYRVFSERGKIPALANGKFVSNGFGVFSIAIESTWKVHSRFDIEISYTDLDGRSYKNRIPLLISDNDHFAGGHWT